jgi:glucokinase
MRKAILLQNTPPFRMSSFNSLVNIPLTNQICAGVAGPVMEGRAEITNLPWKIDSRQIAATTGVNEVQLLNDLESTAYGLAGLNEKDFVLLSEGQPGTVGHGAIIAPGTGLGEAGLYWDGQDYHPLPTEGGHCDFSPRTVLDFELLVFLQHKYGVVSWEKLISGPGIHDIYLFLRGRSGEKEPTWIRDALAGEDPSAAISKAGIENSDPVCAETMKNFVRFIARESSNLVLKMKATGGLFLGGGIPPKIAPMLKGDWYYSNYLDCDRMQHLLRQSPIRIINNEKTALIGAAWYGAYGKF